MTAIFAASIITVSVSSLLWPSFLQRTRCRPTLRSFTVIGAVPMEVSEPPSARKQSAQVFALISSVPVVRLDRVDSAVPIPFAAPDVRGAGPSAPDDG